MLCGKRCAKVNVRLIVVLIVVTITLGVSLVAARQLRRSILSERDFKAGQTAFEKKDWPEAVKNYREYLGRRPDDVETLRKYARACLSLRPLDAAAITGAISAYRRVVQLDPRDPNAYAELARLYPATKDFEELAYIARARLASDPNDRKAPLWLAQALVQLNKTQEAEQTLRKLIDALQALPGKQAEYVQACVQMSAVVGSGRSPEAASKALEWLNRAVEYDRTSVEALAYRAQFYRVAPDLPGVSTQDRQIRARKDLEAADALGTRDPRIRYSLGAEWMAHGELDRAAAELQAVENLPQEALEERFLDIRDWTMARFLFASELAMRRGTPADVVSLADEALTALTEKGHRVKVLPSAIPLYVAAGKVAEARRYLDEYLDILHTQEGVAESPAKLGWLRAVVAKAEDRPYVVIDTVQPIVVTDNSRPGLWRLLAEAYVRIGRSRQAVNAMLQYLRFYPQDADVTLQLAREYSKLGDWNKAFETAQLAESLDPASTGAKLVRIGTGIYLAAEQRPTVDKMKLTELSAQLAELRRDHPEQVDVRTLQASIVGYLGQPDQAESELKLAIQECQEPLKAEMQLGRHYSQNKKPADAAAVYQAACTRHPQVAEPWLSLAEFHVANADYEAARQCLRQGLEAVMGGPEKRSLSRRLAVLDFAQGNRAAGIGLLQELAAQDQQETGARLLLLGTREIQGDRAAAEKLIGELRQIEGESGLWWRLHQASLWLSSEAWRSRQQDITSMLQYCITADGEWSAPALLLADMYERLGDRRGVENICRQTLTRNPQALDVADRLLILLEKQSRFAEAQQVLQQVKATPQVAGAWSIRMAIQAGDVSRAIDELKLRAASDEGDANARIQLARLVYQQTKDSVEALRHLKEAEALTPDSRSLIWAKASILAADGREEEARRTLDDYVAKHNDFNAYWTRGSYLAVQDKPDLAEQDFRKLTTLTERGAAGCELLCNFYVYYKKSDQAITTIEEGLAAYPEELRLQRKLMQLLFLRAGAQDRDRALVILAALEKKLPQDAELMTIRAVHTAAEATPQSLAAAREKLENATQIEPTAVNAHLVLVGIAMQQRDYRAASDFAVRALGSNPDQPALLAARGGAELALKNTPLAVELARLALQKDPNYIEATMVLAQAGLSSNDRSILDEALTRLETYCRAGAGSRSVAALLTLADLCRLSGDPGRAERWIQQAEQLDANNLTVVHARFLWLAAQKRYEELARLISGYLSAKEQEVAMVTNAALVLSSLDSAELKKEAVRLAEHAVALAPSSVNVRLGLASVLYQTGDPARAEKIYRSLLEQAPNDTRALNDLAWILQEHFHRYEEALALADKGIGLVPDDVHLLDTRGTILMNMADRLKDAKSDFARIVELSPSDPGRQAKAYLQLGRVGVKLGDLSQAREYFQKALEIDKRVNVFTPDERAEIGTIMGQTGE